MKDIEIKANCPYKSDIKCDAAVNLLCDNLCKHHPRYIESGSNMNFQTHRCPYSDGTTCSGETCSTDCFLRPDYEEDADTTKEYENGLPIRNLSDEEYTEIKKKFKAFEEGFEMGFNFALEKEEPELKYDNGVADGIDKLDEWYKEGRRVGYDRGVAEGYAKGKEDAMIGFSEELEDAYLSGYKDCFYGEQPMIEDDELRDVLSQQPPSPKGCRVNSDTKKVVNGDMYVSGKILCMIEDAKEKLKALHSTVLASGIKGEKEQRNGAVDILGIIEILNRVQQEYTSDALQEYLGYEI